MRIRKKKVSGFVYLLSALSCVLVVSSASPAFASGFGADTQNVMNMIRVIAMAGTAVGIAACGIKYMISSEQEASKALNQMLLLLGALVALFFLPAAIRLGRSIGDQLEWKPSNLS